MTDDARYTSAGCREDECSNNGTVIYIIVSVMDRIFFT